MPFEDLDEALAELGNARVSDFDAAWHLSRWQRAKVRPPKRSVKVCEECGVGEVVAEGKASHAKYCSAKCQREAHCAQAKEEWRRHGAARRRPLRAALKAALSAREAAAETLSQAEKEAVVRELLHLVRWRREDGAFVLRAWAGSGETPHAFARRLGVEFERLRSWKRKAEFLPRDGDR